MEELQNQKFVCKFCEKSFPNGKSLGGHMRGHLALISSKKDEQLDNGELGLVRVFSLVQENTHKSQMGLRENPKKSWRVSEPKRVIKEHNVCKKCGKGFLSLRALAGHMRSHSLKRKQIISATNLCRKCGKGFDSTRALYGHMRSHSKRSEPSSDSEEEEEEEEDSKIEQETEEIIKPIRKKRSSTRYKSTTSNTTNFSTSSSLNSVLPISENEEVEELAMCLMMLSKDVRSWDGVDIVMVQTEIEVGHELIENGDNTAEFGVFDCGYSVNGENKTGSDVSIGGSHVQEGLKFKNHSELGLEKDLVTEVESGMGLVKKCNSRKKCKSNGQDFGIRGKSKCCDQNNVHNATDSKLLKDLVRKSKEHQCPICLKSFGSGQALGGHKRKHYNELTATESRATVEQEFADIHKLFELNNLPVSIEEGSSGDIGFKLSWVGSDIERDPLVIVN